MNKSLFRPEVLQKQQHRLTGNINLVQPAPVRWLTAIVVSLVAVALLFLVTGQYSRKQQVSGVLQPQAGVIRLQLQSSGVVSRLLVRDGQQVAAGAPLAEISSQQFAADNAELAATLLSQAQTVLARLHDEKLQLQTQHQLASQRLVAEINSLQAQLTELAAQQNTLTERLQLNGGQLAKLKTLAGSGFISELEINRQQDLLLSLQQQDKSMRAQVLQLKQQLAGQQNQQQSLPAQQQQAIAALEQQISQQQSRLAELTHQQKSVLTAPLAGTVSTLQLKPGQQVNSGELALSLLPLDPQLEAVLYLPTAAIGFVAVGQEARLRYHAYPYQRFGIFSGQIVEISDTVLLPADLPQQQLAGPSFRVRVALPAQHVTAYQKQLPLKAGMTVDADLITERRSLWQWLFDPVYSLRGQF